MPKESTATETRLGDGRNFHPARTLDYKQTNLNGCQCSDWARTSENTELATLGKISGALRHLESSNGCAFQSRNYAGLD